MQKIMFNDKYGLTQAVLEGRKTNTRRIIDAPSSATYMEPVLDLCGNIIKVYALDPDGRRIGVFYPKYRVGEVVAVAQSYYSLNKSGYLAPEWLDHYCEDSAGYENKMFVRADLMPHQIRFTGLRVERLQDISDEDCLREGIWKDNEGGRVIGYPLGIPFYYTFDGAVRDGEQLHWTKPKEAFAALIDKVSSRGTWGNNPWDFAYEFELVK